MPFHRRLLALFSALPLRFLLIALFVAQVISVALAIGLISSYNSRSAVHDVAQQLQAEVSARIEQHMVNFLGKAHQINELNANLIAQGILDTDNVSTLQATFLAQVAAFDTPSSVYFGNPLGGLAGAGRELTGEYYVTQTEDLRAGTFEKTMLDTQNQPLRVVSTVPGFDATTRPWYQRCIQLREANWSDVYVRFTGDDVAVAACRPIYAQTGDVLGVVAVDISAAHLTYYLQNLQIGKTGIGFVLERSGLLVTSSTQSPVVTPEGNELIRLAATQSDNPMIQKASAFLVQHFGSYAAIHEAALLRFTDQQEIYFVQVTPHQDNYGLDWLTVVVIPQADFMERIDQNRVTTILLSVVAVLISVIVAAVLAQKVSQPLQQMHASTRQVSAGQWHQLSHHSRVVEFRELIAAYNQMVAQIQRTMEQLSAEVALRRQTESVLSESEERLSFVIAGAQLGTWDWQIQTGAATFNQHWAEMLGYKLEELAPNIETWQMLVHPGDLPQVMRTLETHLQGQSDEYQIEYRLRTKSGEWKWVLDTGRVVERDAHGVPIRAAGIHQDITKRKFAEEALIASHEELEATLHELQATQQQMMQQERLAAVGQLAAGIAHDFNNVLAAILMYGQISLREMNLSPQLQRRLEVIVEQSRQGADLVQQILDFGRAAVMRVRPVDLSLVIADTVRLAQATLPETIKIEFEHPGLELSAEVDPPRIQQALINLFLNARDAMHSGGIVEVRLGTLDLSLEGSIHCAECGVIYGGHWIHLIVADSGTGIAPEHLPRIFEPFFTSKGPQGHGLGLAQVHGIIKQHGGHIQVESQERQGTTFHIYLPLYRPNEVIATPLKLADQSTEKAA